MERRKLCQTAMSPVPSCLEFQHRSFLPIWYTRIQHVQAREGGNLLHVVFESVQTFGTRVISCQVSYYLFIISYLIKKGLIKVVASVLLFLFLIVCSYI